jgi:hypothetical protein
MKRKLVKIKENVQENLNNIVSNAMASKVALEQLNQGEELGENESRSASARYYVKPLQENRPRMKLVRRYKKSSKK